MNAFDYGGAGGGGGVSPYVVSQQTGAYQFVPDFLDTKHPIADAGDADAYLARLEAFVDEIDGNIDRVRHDAALGVVPPDFLLDTTLPPRWSRRGCRRTSTELIPCSRRAPISGRRAFLAIRCRRRRRSITPRSARRWTG